ncbi:MAG: lipid-binding SYLF domain-containing protein [Bryobacteraceae bacterium]
MKHLTICLLVAATTLGAADKKNKNRLEDAASVFEEIMSMKDKSIPQDLLDRSACTVVVPGMKKGGFILAAKYGKGYITCRNKSGTGWSAPGAVRVEGGSVGFQIGGSETDIVLLVMNEKGAEKLLSSKFTLGGEGSVAAGPVGRDSSAQTDAQMRAEILSYSRSRGVFAGISLTGSTLRQDLDDNEEVYGKRLENREIVLGTMEPPTSAKRLISLLNKYSPRKNK